MFFFILKILAVYKASHKNNDVAVKKIIDKTTVDEFLKEAFVLVRCPLTGNPYVMSLVFICFIKCTNLFSTQINFK